MKKIAFCAALISLFFASCNVTTEGFWSGDSNVNHRFSGLKHIEDSDVAAWKNEAPSSYQVLVITDVHIGAKFFHNEIEDKFFTWLEAYDKSNIKFALGLGDFADGAKEGEFQHYAEMISKVRSLCNNVPFLNVIGNHDLYRDNGFEMFEKYCYPNCSYYKFETPKLTWYGLDTASGTLGSRQLASLKKELVEGAVIVTHVPFASEGKSYGIMPFCLRDTTERNILISLFSQRKILGYFCGHYHPGGYETFGNVTQYGLKSFGEYHKWYILDVDETSTPPVITVHQYPN